MTTQSTIKLLVEALEWCSDLTQTAIDYKPLHEAIAAGRAALTAPEPQAPTVKDCLTVQPQAQGVLEWAINRWNDEVRYRPIINKNRRTLDDTWRQVIRFAGGDPDILLGPAHDALLAAAPKPAQAAEHQPCAMLDGQNSA